MAQNDETTETKSGTKLPRDGGAGSPSNYKKSPERQKEKSLGVHVDPYAERKPR